MPKRIVINTGALIAIIAGLGDLKVLGKLYEEVIVPYEVKQEMLSKEKFADDDIEDDFTATLSIN